MGHGNPFILGVKGSKVKVTSDSAGVGLCTLASADFFWLYLLLPYGVIVHIIWFKFCRGWISQWSDVGFAGAEIRISRISSVECVTGRRREFNRNHDDNVTSIYRYRQ